VIACETVLELLCVADMCVDLILTGDVRPRFGQAEQLVEDYFLELGGSANLVACQFAKLGGQAGVLGWLGGDLFGDFALRRLGECGVDTALVRRNQGMKTGIGVALAEPGDRAILTYSGTIGAVRPDQLEPGLLTRFRHWHVASYFLMPSLRPVWPSWLRRCKEAGRTTSFDPNWDPSERWEGVAELLPWLDVLLPNEQEALAITGAGHVYAAGRQLASRGPLVVIKRGAKGALAFQDARVWEQLPSAQPAIVDTVGAGDNFAAGFLRGWLLGWTVPDCLQLAERCAVASLGCGGGIAGQIREIHPRVPA